MERRLSSLRPASDPPRLTGTECPNYEINQSLTRWIVYFSAGTGINITTPLSHASLIKKYIEETA